MNKYYDIMKEIEEVYNEINQYVLQYLGIETLYSSLYIIDKNIEKEDYHGNEFMLDILSHMKKYDKLSRIIINPKKEIKDRTNINSPIMIDKGNYTYHGFVDKLESIIYDGYHVQETSHILPDGRNEIIGKKNINSELEPSIISNSGKAVFSLYDSENKVYKYFDDEYLSKKIMDNGNKPFYEWDEDDFVILRLSLPSS